MNGALGHLTVLDLTHWLAGPYCTKLFAAYGATVIKVERPGTGDPVRSAGPFYEGREDRERSIPFLWLNTGKKSVTLDLKTAAGRELALALAERADVVVESFRPGVLDRLGLGWEALHARNPRCVLTSISSFGQTGPYRDWAATDMTLYALAGLMHCTGDPDRPPLRSGPAVAQYTGALGAYMGTLMALFARSRTGRGQHVDVSLHEAAIENIEIQMVDQLHLGRNVKRNGDNHVLFPWQLQPCKDGQAAVVGGPVRHWLAAAPMFEEPRLLQDPYRRMDGRMAHRGEVAELLAPWLMRHTRHEVYHEGQRRRLAFGYLASMDEALESPQLAARGFFEEIDHPVVGAQRYAGAPFRPQATPPRQTRAPLLGEHADEVLCELLGRSRAEVEAWRAEGVV